ncbi:ABC transporter ATP-binding protein [Nakamurella alba]|uniref:ABC transporter ATP-binding protein n=1 Tax=Nakamurella alba TaxID=2665158 RepID=UPI0012B75E36|nr:ATP-binding cassette domain-containing protein [Nakamurella alba]
MSSIRVSGLSARYGQARALVDVEVDVHKEEIVAILGHNGAGKSTLLKSIARVHREARGTIEIGGRSVVELRPNAVAAMGVSLVREGAPVFTHLTVEENLKLGARLGRRRGRDAAAIEDAFEWFPMLGERRHAMAGVLSGGQRQMLCLSQALVSRPDVLLLDEPSAGLAPSMTEAVFQAIQKLCRTGVAVLLAEQDMRWVEGFASRYYVIETGRVAESRPLGAGLPGPDLLAEEVTAAGPPAFLTDEGRGGQQ